MARIKSELQKYAHCCVYTACLNVADTSWHPENTFKLGKCENDINKKLLISERKLKWIHLYVKKTNH